MNKYRTIRLGNCEFALTHKELSYKSDLNSSKKLSLSYEVPEELAESTRPILGSTSEHMEGVYLDSITITPGEAGIAVVKLEYISPQVNELENEEEEEEEEPEEDEENDDEDEEGEIVDQSLEGAVSDEPVLTHPLCAEIPRNEIEYLKSIQDGARLWETAYQLDEKGKVIMDKDGHKVKKTLQQLMNNASERAKNIGEHFILKGIHSYRSPNGTWRERRLAKSREINLDGLGKIATPKDAPTPKGRDWLMIGKNVTRNADGKTWTIETVYELSSEGGWNEILYKK